MISWKIFMTLRPNGAKTKVQFYRPFLGKVSLKDSSQNLEYFFEQIELLDHNTRVQRDSTA